MRFEALEQTLRLRLVSEHVDKKFFFSFGIACPIQYELVLRIHTTAVVLKSQVLNLVVVTTTGEVL